MYVFLGAEVVKQLHYSPGGYSTKYAGRLCPEVHPPDHFIYVYHF